MFTIIGADQKEYGPATVEELRQWIQDGRADGRTLAKADGTGEWKPLSSYPEFAGVTAAPGAPPRITASPAYSPNYSNDPNVPILAPELNFDFSGCINRGWTLLLNNFGVLVAGTVLIWLAQNLIETIPLVNLLTAFFSGVLYGGLYLFYLKQMRGEIVPLKEVFSGFGVPFVQLLLAGFLTSVLTGVGMLLCAVPGIFLKVVWIFTLPLVIDKRLEFWTAMELSRKVALRVWFKLFIFLVVIFAPYLIFQGYVNYTSWSILYPKWNALVAGGITASSMTSFFNMIKDLATQRQFVELQIAARIVFLVNLPIATAALMYAYESLFGPRPAPAA